MLCFVRHCLLWVETKLLEMYYGDVCATIEMCLMQLNWTLKKRNVVNIISGINTLPHLTKEVIKVFIYFDLCS